ncbi:MAG: dTMP kinase [Ferroplasma sp.]|uniref:dTMP kinase n=1 Tax=Ferroplasma sp. TaxID=2591003 RepID=UPI0028166A24|nr:dTMP kinase [Ferroplasma sp.]WMT51613.1 MAG: dTMP kinase [Ferroplasma sp.]
MFVTMEGIDGSGKTTLINSLKPAFPDFHYTKEPTDAFQFGELKKLSSPENSFYNFFLFTYDRLNHQEELKSNKKIICDRYLASSIAYEGPMIEKLMGDQKETVRWMVNVSKMMMMPDIIIYLDVDIDTAVDRIRASRKNLNFRGRQLSILEERQGLSRIKEYYNYFLDNISEFIEKPVDVIKINGNDPAELVLEQARKIIESI